jgi:glycosyltransferase involved in cell wall biosynthesis
MEPRYAEICDMKNTTMAIYLPDLTGGGVERMKIIMAGAFVKRGYDITFVLNKAQGELMSLLPPSVKVVSLDAPRTLSALPKLVSYLRRERPDILLSSMGHNNIVSLWARRIANVPTAVIVSQHNSLSTESGAMGNWQHRALPLMYRLFCRYADAVISVSKGVADDMAATTNYPREKITVLYNPILFNGFHDKAAEPVSHPWFEDNAGPVFIGIGRLVAQKDFPTLIRAFALLDLALNARLIILGEGPLRESLQALAKELHVADRIDLIGFQKNPLPYLRSATAMVMSSQYEGFGNVLIEAMGCGTPVVSTDCRYGPSEILADGRLGPLVPVGDAKALSQAMAGILDSHLSPEELKARASDFSVDHVVEAYLALFQKALANAAGRYPGRVATQDG